MGSVRAPGRGRDGHICSSSSFQPVPQPVLAETRIAVVLGGVSGSQATGGALISPLGSRSEHSDLHVGVQPPFNPRPLHLKGGQAAGKGLLPETLGRGF